jgi:Flp pilus assembly protein TadG
MNQLQDENGQALVLMAAFMGLLMLGFLALALDIGLLFRDKRNAQAAADAAALAAAEELASGSTANEQTVANAMAKMHGFDTALATNPATVTLLTPNTGNFMGSTYVQATVSQPIRTFFLGAFSSKFAATTVSAQATAGGGQLSPTCVCLEGTSGQDLNLSNNARLSALQCGVINDSSSSNAVGIVGGSSLNALSLGTVSSTWNNGSNISNGGSISSSTKVIQGITSSCAPPMPAAPTYSNCVADPGGSSSSFTAGPASSSGTICYKSLTVGANGSLDTLNPGTYVITTGALHFESGPGGVSNLGGNGVYFYLTGTASLVVDNGANINLVSGGSAKSGGGTAPSLGTSDGILVYQASSDTAAMSIQGGSTSYLSGGLFFPSASVTLGNGSSTSFNSSIVAQTLTMNGGAILNAVSSSNLGTLNISVSKLVQ